MFLKEELKQIGLSDNEVNIYNVLMDIGECTVGPIIAKNKMHRQVAYDNLGSLIEKDMVIKTTKNGRFRYRIADPKNILENLKLKEKISKKIVREVENKLKGQKKGQEIKIHEGEKAFRDLFIRNDELMDSNSIFYAVGDPVQKWMDMIEVRGMFEISNKIRNKKNIKTKVISSEKFRERVKSIPRVNYSVKFIDQDIYTPISFYIWKDSINLISFGNDVFVIEIKNEDFRNAYLNYFKILWKIARK